MEIDVDKVLKRVGLVLILIFVIWLGNPIILVGVSIFIVGTMLNKMWNNLDKPEKEKA